MGLTTSDKGLKILLTTDKTRKKLPTTDMDRQYLVYIYMSDLVKTWSLVFCLGPGTARLQASPMSTKVGGLTSWSVQLDSPGTALTVGGWIRPWGQN